MAIVTELVTKFVFQGNTQPLANFNKSLGKSIFLIGGFASAVTATSIVFARWTHNILSSLNPLIQLSKITGLAVDEIQSLGFAASMSGSSIQAMESTLANLSKKIGNAALKGDADFYRLGIAVRDSMGQVKNADKILEEIAERFKDLNLSMAEKVSIASSLGIDSSLIELLGKTSKEFKSLREQSKGFGVLTAKQVEQVEAYNKSVAKLNAGFHGLKNLIAVGLAPELGKLADYFTGILSSKQGSIVKFFEGMAEGLGEIIKLIERTLPFTAALTAGFVALSVASGGLAATLWAVAWPILGVAAAVGAAIIAIDDLMMPSRGGKSFIMDKLENSGFGENIGQAASIFSSWAKPLPSDGDTVSQNINIDIHTDDPEQAGKSVVDNLQKQIETAKILLSKGGM